MLQGWKGMKDVQVRRTGELERLFRLWKGRSAVLKSGRRRGKRRRGKRTNGGEEVAKVGNGDDGAGEGSEGGEDDCTGVEVAVSARGREG